MNHKKYWIVTALIATGLLVACSVDESKFPLPYNSRTTGAYARLYQIKSSSFAVGDPLAAFQAIFEPVDGKDGNDTDSIMFYVSHRRGSSLSREVFVKAVPIDASFVKVPAPTYSVYRRGLVTITQAEMEAALAPFAGIDPDGPATPTANFLAAYPGLPTNAGDQFVIRWTQKLKDGRKFTVFNPQQNVNPAFGNPTEENGTPNITTGLFYSSPFTFTMNVRTLVSVAGVPYTGTYRLVMVANWSPAHTNAAGIALHALSFPSYMNSLTFPDQDVIVNPVAGGLISEREFSVNYRGSAVTMRLNFENINPNFSGATRTNMNNPVAPTAAGVPTGMGLPGGPFVNANLGTVFLPLMNTGADCSSTREFYWITPAGGSFGGSAAAYQRFDQDGTGPLGTVRPGIPAFTHPNRGTYRTNDNGLTSGTSWFSIGVDDDADEYGRRNGYCTWTRRCYLVLTKL